jgi:hypothetical protein
MSGDSEEIKLVIFKKIPIFLLGAAIGLGVVWVALQFIPAAAVSAVSVLGL